MMKAKVDGRKLMKSESNKVAKIPPKCFCSPKTLSISLGNGLSFVQPLEVEKHHPKKTPL